MQSLALHLNYDFIHYFKRVIWHKLIFAKIFIFPNCIYLINVNVYIFYLVKLFYLFVYFFIISQYIIPDA